VAFVGLALLFIVLKALDVGFMAKIDWIWICVPLGAAVAWWAFADKFGYTQRKAMEEMETKKEARRQRQLEAMGRGDANKKKR
jgi:small Trp-rich protein